MTPELDQARREFLDECDLVVRVPATITLSGSTMGYECITMAIPLYSYVGVKVDSKTFQCDELKIDNKVHFGKDMIDASNMKFLSKGSGSFEEVYLGLIKTVRLERLGVKHKEMDKFSKIKLKIWSEVPANRYIMDMRDLGFIILIYCLGEGIKPEHFNLLKDNYKQACLKSGKYLPGPNSDGKHGIALESITLIKKILTGILKYCIFLYNGGSYMCSLIGALEKKQEERLDIGDLEGIYFRIPKIKIPEEQLKFSFGDCLSIDWTAFREKGEDLRKLMLEYVDDIIQHDKLEAIRKMDVLNGTHFALVYWRGRKEGLFGPIISPPYFLDAFENANLNIEVQKPMSLLDPNTNAKISFSNGIMRLYGSDSILSESLKQIEQSRQGWIHYFSFSQQLGVPEEGARFLMPDEYKLPKDVVTVDGITPRKSGKENIRYARMWNKESKTEGEYIDKDVFDKLETSKAEYEIFIVDNGEYKMGSVGKVYLNDQLVLKQEDSDKKKHKKQEIKDYLTPIEYKLLVYTLKNNYRAGTMIDIVEKCWGKKALVDGPDGLRKELKKDKDAFMRKTSGYRKTIGNLSKLLYNTKGLHLRSGRTGSFSLTRKPKFCLLEIL